MTPSDKILGVHVDDKLMWNDYFQHVSNKISSYLWLLSKIRSYLSVYHRLMLYNAHVKLHFEYRNTVWSNTSSGNINKISKLQRRACKLILSQDYTDIQEALKRLYIESIDQIIFSIKVRKTAKIRKQYNQAPHLTQNTTWERDKITIRHHKQEPRGQPFPSRWPQGSNEQTWKYDKHKT